ncbi:MAG: prepilin-type N-terminal cleavage/methylation domain-containing protein [Gammaproteobacteria bacterium]|jgi:general secretion pathway protein I|nr:prepilin-type N-terminal cleavage/methylation domain-containing protein [Gammaproteobacteria bacterium]
MSGPIHRAGHRAGRQGRTGQRGFSLLEVLVAFAILALSLGVLLQIFSRALNTTALNETYSRAVALAEAKLEGVGVSIPLEEGVYSGDPEDGMDWVISIAPYQPGGWLGDAAAFASYQVSAVASWPSASGTRRVTLRTIRLGQEPDF